MTNSTFVGPSDKIYGETLNIVCKGGYRIQNEPNENVSLTLTCPENGEWPVFPGCEKKGILKTYWL